MQGQRCAPEKQKKEETTRHRIGMTTHAANQELRKKRASFTAGALEGTLPASQPETLQKVSTDSFNGGL